MGAPFSVGDLVNVGKETDQTEWPTGGIFQHF